MSKAQFKTRERVKRQGFDRNTAVNTLFDTADAESYYKSGFSPFIVSKFDVDVLGSSHRHRDPSPLQKSACLA